MAIVGMPISNAMAFPKPVVDPPPRVTAQSAPAFGHRGLRVGAGAGVAGIEVAEAAVGLEAPPLEAIPPPAGVCAPSPPRAVHVLAGARALAGERVRAGRDPVEVRVVVLDGL